MSSSSSSLKRCFWRAFIIENAMAMVSSCISRLSSPKAIRSPSMRITGWLPTLRWRSEAFRSTAIFNRSLTFIWGLLPGPCRLALGRYGRGGRLRDRRADRIQPAVAVGDLTADDAFELGHDAPRDLSWGAMADRIAVHGANRRDLG